MGTSLPPMRSLAFQGAPAGEQVRQPNRERQNIDSFLSALAKVQRRVVGVDILSGMDGDGTLGDQGDQERGGLHDGPHQRSLWPSHPRNARKRHLRTGCCDFEIPAEGNVVKLRNSRAAWRCSTGWRLSRTARMKSGMGRRAERYLCRFWQPGRHDFGATRQNVSAPRENAEMQVVQLRLWPPISRVCGKIQRRKRSVWRFSSSTSRISFADGDCFREA